MAQYDLPQNPFMLLSFINMKLRDQYSSLDELCNDLGIQRLWIETSLRQAGFEYDPVQNKFW